MEKERLTCTENAGEHITVKEISQREHQRANFEEI